MISTPLTVHDYKFLKGDKIYWPTWGAGLAVTMEYCRNRGLGEFGQPSELGAELMKQFEQENR
jgi:hypothetical protein